LGIERLIELIDAGAVESGPDAYLVAVGERAQREALLLAEQLRDQLPALRLLCHCGGGSFKSQFKKADRSGARLALVLGDDELAQGRVGIKPLRHDGEQQHIAVDALPQMLAEYLRSADSGIATNP